MVKPNLVLRLGWGFDNNDVMKLQYQVNKIRVGIKMDCDPSNEMIYKLPYSELYF